MSALGGWMDGWAGMGWDGMERMDGARMDRMDGWMDRWLVEWIGWMGWNGMGWGGCV